jgi:hypothetical protein
MPGGQGAGMPVMPGRCSHRGAQRTLTVTVSPGPLPPAPGVPASASSTMASVRPAATSNQWAVTRNREASHSLRLGAGVLCSPGGGSASTFLWSSSCQGQGKVRSGMWP